LSYTLLVQSERPLGYWKLNGDGTDYSGSNTASISSLATSSLPLVANSSSALLVKKSGASVSIANNYDALHAKFEKTKFTVEFWISFNSNFDGSGMLINSSTATRYFVNNQLKIIKFMNGATEVGSILYDYNKNTLRFVINGTKNSDAYIPIRNLNSSIHVIAHYDNGKTSIIMNGEEGVNGEVKDYSLFPARNASGYNIVIDGTSINSSSSNFVINDLAIYDYKLPMDSIRKRVVWAHHNDKPAAITGKLATSYFDIYEKSHHMFSHYSISGGEFYQNTYISNLNIDDEYGLIPININSLSIDTSVDTTASASYSSSGVSLNNSAGIIINKPFDYMKNNNVYTFTAQIVKGSASADHIFSFLDINTGKIIDAKIQNDGFYVYYYDQTASSYNKIVSATSTLTTGSSYNFGVSFNSGSVYLYGNSVSAVSGSMTNILVNNNSNIVIGNVSAIPDASNTSTIKNFGYSNIFITDFSTTDFTQNKMFMARLTNDLSVSQVGYWVKTLPLTILNNNAVASKISWDGADNCLVELSTDNGNTWQKITSSKQLPSFVASSLNVNSQIRVTMPYDYDLESSNQSFNNLDISFYRTLSLTSTDGIYEMIPYSDSSSIQSYTIQRNDQPITFRKNNFGIKFDNYSGSTKGYAYIVNNSSTASPYAIDFWLNVESLPSASNFLIDLSTNVITYSDIYQSTYTDLYGASAIGASELNYLYIDGSTNRLIFSPSATAKVYLNGNQISSNSTSVTLSEYYHILFDFGSSVSPSATIALNSRISNSSATHTNAGYGYMNIWNSSVSASTASSRYSSFIALNTFSVTDVNASSALWQQNWYQDAITTASVFKINS